VRRARQLELERQARQQEAARGGGYMYGGSHEADRGGVLPALGGTALRIAASASKSLPGLLSPSPRCADVRAVAPSRSLLPPALSKPAKSFLPAALGSKLGSLGKRGK
jgi:hypothetical protein